MTGRSVPVEKVFGTFCMGALAGPQSHFESCKIPLPEIERLFLGFLVCSVVNIPTTLSWLLL